MSFGRKGVGDPATAAKRAVLPAEERGRAFHPSADDLAARRAAFLAEERARPREPSAGGESWRTAGGFMPKSKSRAYLLWFFGGGVSAHRFYLGYPVSGAIQASFLPLNWALLVSGSYWVFGTMFIGGLWILADAFIIPSLHRDANAKLQQNAFRSVFA
jgi:TM2 domain-containing membrane protein YozV